MSQRILQYQNVADVSSDKPLVASNRHRAQINVQVLDDNGDVITDVRKKYRSQNGSGFVISYTAKMSEFLEKTTAGSVVRVFVYLAHHQDYGTDGKPFGYRCTHKYLQSVLQLNKATLWRALEYLKDNYLVHVGKVGCMSEFMVNPQYVTIGTDKKTRMAEWSRRWQQTFASQR